MRPRRWRTLHFGILGAAAVALLGVFLVREAGDRTPGQPQVAQSPEARGPKAVPVPDLLKSKWVAPEASATGADRASRDAAPAQTPTAGAGAASEISPPGKRVDDATIVALHGREPLTQDHPHVAPAIEIQERHTELLAHPSVVGTAVGLNDEGQVALVVLTKAEAVDIPRVIEGLPVVLWRTGEIYAHHRMSPQDQVGTRDDVKDRTHKGGTDGTARYARPVPIGVSTGHPNITAGTIGCRVKKGTDVFALSNNHVYANENKASIGDNALQPGPYDGGVNPTDAIGTLSAFVTIVFGGSPLTPKNQVDAAIAVSSTANLGNATPSGVGYGTPRSITVSASVGLSVTKVGRTTGPTFGSITGINAKVSVQYSSGIARYKDQIIIGPGTFSAGGDSGSLIVKDGTYEPVGLLFAGSSTVTIANRIDYVLNSFGVTVDGQ